jgi:hypothetical protein
MVPPRLVDEEVIHKAVVSYFKIYPQISCQSINLREMRTQSADGSICNSELLWLRIAMTRSSFSRMVSDH